MKQTRFHLLSKAILTSVCLVVGVQQGFSQDLKDEKILFIGTSQSMSQFGRTLSDDLKAAGAQVDSYWVAGSRIAHWNHMKEKVPYKDKKTGKVLYRDNIANIDQLAIASSKNEIDRWINILPQDQFVDLTNFPKDKYSTVLIELGTNDISTFCQNPKHLVPSFEVIRKNIVGKKCVWIGLPNVSQAGTISEACGHNMKKYNRFVQEMKLQAQAIGCAYMDSEQYKLPNDYRMTKKKITRHIWDTTNINKMITQKYSTKVYALQPSSSSDCRMGAIDLVADDKHKTHFLDASADWWAHCVSVGIQKAFADRSLQAVSNLSTTEESKKTAK